MYFFPSQQSMNSMQFQPWATPFGGFSPSGPSFGVPPFGYSPSICPPGLSGGGPLSGMSSYWSQIMQAQQSLFQGWQQFCGCQGQSQAPQWGNCQPPQQQSPQVVHVHHHYHYHGAQPQSPQPAPTPTPAPTPRPTTPRPTTPTRPSTPPTSVTVGGRPPTSVRPSLPRPPVSTTPALPTLPATPTLPPSFGAIPRPGGGVFGTSPTRPNQPPTMSNGQSIEDIFNNPFAGTGMEYLKDALDTISAVRRIYGVTPNATVGQKGDLRVIAGDRYDGVKPRDIRIDDANNYDYQKGENSYQENRQEFRFKDGTIGREYDITVTWADDTTTRKRVQLKEAGQIVYIRSAEGY